MLPAAFIWFTWGADADCLAHSIESVRRVAPGSPLHVRFDPAHPLPASALWHLTSAGVIVRPSIGPHGGNLTGAAHLLNQLEEMEAAAAPGWIVKVDSDTLIRQLDWLAPALDPTNAINAVGFGASPEVPWCGPCYALRAGIPRALRDTFAAALRPQYRAPEPGPFPAGCPEDATLWRLFQMSHLRNVLNWPTAPDEPFFSGFQYPATAVGEDQIWQHIRTHPAEVDTSIVTFGNRHQVPPTAGNPRTIAAAAMRATLDL